MSSLCACQLLSVYKIRLSKSKAFHGAENITNGSRKESGAEGKNRPSETVAFCRGTCYNLHSENARGGTSPRKRRIARP